MKRLFLLTNIIFLSLSITAQKNQVDLLFDKYSGREGITTVFISGKMLSMVSTVSQENREFNDVVGNLTSIRILSVDDMELLPRVNIQSELANSLSSGGYEEIMVINEGKETVRFYVRETGNTIGELLMVTSGGSSSLISIRGRIDLKSISALSKSLGIEELERLEGVDRKKEVKK